MPGNTQSNNQNYEEMARELGGEKVMDYEEIAETLGGKEIQATTDRTTAATTEEEAPGFAQQITRETAEPFLEFGGTAASLGRGIGRMGQAGVLKARGKDVAAFKKFVSASEPVEIDLGFAGKIQPVESTREAISSGIKIGATIGGVKVVGSGLYQGLLKSPGFWKPVLTTGLAEGAETGVWGAAEAFEKKMNAKESAYEIGTDFALGFLFGGLTSAASKVVGSGSRTIWHGMRKRLGDYPVAQKAGIKPLPALDYMEKAIQKGADEDSLRLIAYGQPEQRRVMKEMFDLAEKNSRTRRVTKRPVQVAGKEVMDRVEHVGKVRRQIGKQLGEAVDKMPERPINATYLRRNYDDILDDFGVKVKGAELDFSNSRFASRRMSSVRNSLQELSDDLKPNKTGGVYMWPKTLHRQRQKMFETLQLGKKQDALTGSSEYALRKIRGQIKTALSDVSDDYSKLSRKYAQTQSALRDFYKLMGRKWEGGEDLIDLRAGEVGNRMMGNASAAPLEILGKIQKIARNSGYARTTNMTDLFHWSDYLEDVFGTTQVRSIGGQFKRAGEDIAQKAGLINDVTEGGITRGLLKALRRTTKGTQEKQRKAVVEGIRKVFDNLLK